MRFERGLCSLVGLGQTCGYFGYFLCYVTVVEDELFVIADGVLSVEAEAENILLSRNQKEAVITDFRIPFLERTFEGDELYGKAKLSLYSSEEAKKEYFDGLEGGSIISFK